MRKRIPISSEQISDCLFNTIYSQLYYSMRKRIRCQLSDNLSNQLYAEFILPISQQKRVG